MCTCLYRIFKESHCKQNLIYFYLNTKYKYIRTSELGVNYFTFLTNNHELDPYEIDSLENIACMIADRPLKVLTMIWDSSDEEGTMGRKPNKMR